jgi:hypothetical protein
MSSGGEGANVGKSMEQRAEGIENIAPPFFKPTLLQKVLLLVRPEGKELKHDKREWS